MKPIHEILDRIRWDTDFQDADFELGYYDRVDDDIVRIRLNLDATDTREGGSFEIVDEEGRTRQVPLHRIRRVWRDRELIWSR